MRTRLAHLGNAAVWWLLATLIGASACSHAEPFTPGGYAPGGPFSDTLPHQLTYNLGTDLTPVWLPDGGALVYAFSRQDRPDRDFCLATLPADGGARIRTICNTGPNTDDSLDAYLWPAIGARGRIAFVQTSMPVGFLQPSRVAIVIASLANPSAATPIRAFPYPSSTGRLDAPTDVAWLGDSALVYVGNTVAYASPCFRCPLDTLVIGQEVVRLDLRNPNPVPQVVPGTSYASSVEPALSGSSAYFTLGGDSRVYQEDLTSGAVTTVHDFGAAGIARDVRVVGNRLVAVVGGSVSFAIDSILGPLQRDGGGTLYAVDLTSGQETVMPLAGRFVRHPALAPDGKRVVVEAYAAGGGEDADLWLLMIP